MNVDSMNMEAKPLIIELVGPPGTGKTTLATTMLKRNNKMQVQVFPYFRRIDQIHFFARNLLLLLPTLLHLYRNRQGGWLTLRDIALMTILQGWHSVLQRQGSGDTTIVILEEGAICLLAKLHGFGSDLLKGENAKKWWNCMYKRWADTLDLVIQLETPIPTLVERIRARDMVHEVDELTDEEACQYLARIKEAQEHVLFALMSKARGHKMLRFNTVDRTSDQIYDQVLALGLEHDGNWFSSDVPINTNLAPKAIERQGNQPSIQ